MPLSVLRVHDELQFKNHTNEFIADTNPSNPRNYENPKKQDAMDVFMVAVMQYSFLLPALKETTVEEWADEIELRYNSPQSFEVAGVLRNFSEKYSA